jgi:hypothetical protein
MNARTTARRGLAIAAIAAAGLIALTGCKIGSGKDAASGTPSAAASPSTSTPASGKAGSNGTPKPSASTSKKSGGNALPDVCTLLTRAEVSALAGGKQVVQVDPDDAKPTDTTRFCQWQLSGARLAVFLSPTTAAEFSQAHTKSRKVTGLGDAAYFTSGHLYVRHGNIVVDVYATNGSDEAAGETMAKAAAAKVIERL